MISGELARIERLEKELSLKQLQIRSLLTITQAINENVSADGLYRMYKNFLSWEMGISKMALYVLEDNEFHSVASIDVPSDYFGDQLDFILAPFERLYTIKETDHEKLQIFNVLIPVRHKDVSIAYALIGGLEDQDDLYNRVQFITTITNIIAVAIENKRLFKQQIDQERYKKEIELAEDVQKMLIPESIPDGKHYEVSKIYKPHFNVGGDYIDFIKYDDDRFVFCIADISGKGVGAALLMANFQAVIQSLIFQYKDLQTFVFALNQAVYRITQSDRYITFFVGQVDIKTMKLRYINAGHHPPFYMSNNKIKRLDVGCTIIGAFEKLPVLEEGEIDIEKDGLIFSFTDGLTELQNDDSEYFNDEKIEAFLNVHSNLDVNTFNDKLQQEIETFKGGQSYTDDIAILTCKIK